MFSNSAIQSEAKGRRTAILIGLIAVVLLVPALMYAFGSNPPLGYTGAPGQGTCASCHGTLTSGSGVTVTVPSTYTPGGAAVSMTVAIHLTGGFELTALTQNANSQAGTLAAGPPPAGAAFPQDGVSTVGAIQFVYSTVETTSWTFFWTPPATNVGNVVLYVTGGGHSPNYSNSYAMTPAGPPPPPTMSASPTSLTFTVNGAEPAAQPVSITSGGAPIAVTTGVSTVQGGNWLTLMPPGGDTPLSATVGIVAVGLAAGTYTGSLSFTSTGASNSPLSVSVTLNVITPIPPAVPTLDVSRSALTFTATAGGTVSPPDPQTVMVTTSDGSAVAFNASATTASGGNWLSAGPGTGTTPAPEFITVTLPSGLATGTYHGTVTFTSSAVSNSPVSLPVTLNVIPQSTVPPLHFCFVVVDRQSHGTKWILLDGTGSVSSSDQVTGAGFFTVFRTRASGEGESTTSSVVANGTWTATSVTNFTPVSGSSTGGVLVLQVQISTKGGSTTTGSMTISSTGTNSGVTLDIDEDNENHKDLHFVNVGINNKVSINLEE